MGPGPDIPESSDCSCSRCARISRPGRASPAWALRLHCHDSMAATGSCSTLNALLPPPCTAQVVTQGSALQGTCGNVRKYVGLSPLETLLERCCWHRVGRAQAAAQHPARTARLHYELASHHAQSGRLRNPMTGLREAGVAPGSRHGWDKKIPEVQESSPCHSRPLSHK